MKRTISGNITAWLSSYYGPEDVAGEDHAQILGRVTYTERDMASSGYTNIGMATITLEIPDDKTLIDSKADSLRAEIKKVKADAQNAITELTDKLNKLLAITNEVKP